MAWRCTGALSVYDDDGQLSISGGTESALASSITQTSRDHGMGFIQDAFESISGRVSDLIDARSVLHANGKTKRSFDGHIVGYFHRSGPNSWDDYQLVPKDDGPIDVFPSIEIQVEPLRSRFRMRTRGKVAMVQWVPTAEERAALQAGGELHEAFLESCVDQFKHSAGIGVAAFVAKTLRRR